MSSPPAADSPGPLRVPAFRGLWLAGFLSEIGDWMLLIALPLYVLALTGSPLQTSTVFVLGLLPNLALGPFAGVLADRWDRRTILVWVSLAQAALLLALLAVADAGGLWIVYLVAVGESALAAIFEPAKNALLPTLVGERQVVSANALIGLNSDLGRLVGSPVGGLLLTAGGLPWVVYIDAASFFAVALLAGLGGWRGQVRTVSARQPFFREWLDGIAHIRRTPQLRVSVAVYGLMSVAQGLFVLLFVLFVRDALAGGEAATGLLRGVQAIGGLLGGLAVGAWAHRYGSRALTGWGLVIFAVVTLLTWNGPLVTTSLGVYIGLYVAAGVPAAAAVAGLLSGVQSAVSDLMRGRVLAAFLAVGDGMQAIGMLVAGFLASMIGLPVLLDAQGLLYLAAGLLALAGGSHTRTIGG